MSAVSTLGCGLSSCDLVASLAIGPAVTGFAVVIPEWSVGALGRHCWGRWFVADVRRPRSFQVGRNRAVGGHNDAWMTGARHSLQARSSDGLELHVAPLASTMVAAWGLLAASTTVDELVALGEYGGGERGHMASPWPGKDARSAAYAAWSQGAKR